jgi:RimJ/RimL family protein N-acetyltransferase
MDVPELRGSRVTLRALLPSDRGARIALGRDPEFVRLNGGDASTLRPFTEADADRWFRGRGDSLRWAIVHEAQLVGEIRLDRLDEANRSARLAMGIYAPTHRGRGFGTEAARLVLDHAFGELALHRVDLNVLEFNEGAMRLYERLGFRRDGVLRHTVLVGGDWLNDVRMSLLEDEHRDAR